MGMRRGEGASEEAERDSVVVVPRGEFIVGEKGG